MMVTRLSVPRTLSGSSDDYLDVVEILLDLHRHARARATDSYILGILVNLPPPRPSTSPTNTTIEDIPSSSTQPLSRSSHMMSSHSSGYSTSDPYMQDILQHLQGISLRQHEDREYFDWRIDVER
jgi:hypothetical protein